MIRRRGYDSALKDAIYRFHKTDSESSAKASLAQYLTKFLDDARKEAIRHDLDRYLHWYSKAGVIVATSRLRIAFDIGSGVLLAGEIGRIDVDPVVDTYRAICFARNGSIKKTELRWPLIQAAVAQKFGRPVEKTFVGLQDLSTLTLASAQYSIKQIKSALEEAAEIAQEVETSIS